MQVNLRALIGETTEYDKKRSVERRQVKSWLKSVSAFANSFGGTLIWGIANDDEVIGLEDAESDAEFISETIKTKIDSIPNVNLRFHAEGDKKLLLLDVYAGKETPYYYVGEGNMTAYIRLGNESVPADNITLKRLVLRGTNHSYDSLVSNYKFANMAFTKLRSVCKHNTGKDFEDSDYESWGIIDGEGNLTNAGALLADESPIRHSRVFCTRWNGLDKASGLIDAIDDEEYSGGLVNLLQDSMSFVSRNTKKAWKKTGNGRIEMPDYPDTAVLEGIVNALIHRDYLELGSEVHIDMFDDRIEIYSPGGMPDGRKVQDLDLRNVSSKRRNPVIADIFNRLKYMDRRGSGFKKILDSYEFQERYTEEMKPEFKSNNTEFWLIFKNLNYNAEDIGNNLSAQNADQKMPIKNADKKMPIKTQHQLEKILQYLSAQSECSCRDICIILNIKERRARQLLQILQKQGRIKTIGVNKTRRYRLMDSILESNHDMKK
ncbi:MAG: putative DNA binding domain-containing protein [Muribaculaceae bacterium]|nr:putative DNA binding domain-containing protein [Muribaculaceae bacterium]